MSAKIIEIYLYPLLLLKNDKLYHLYYTAKRGYMLALLKKIFRYLQKPFSCCISNAFSKHS